MSEPLTVDMFDQICTKTTQRMERFGEGWQMALGVVLFNFGESRRIAHCIAGDWSGPKSDMARADSGLPICPLCGRPATEDAKGWRFELVEGKDE